MKRDDRTVTAAGKDEERMRETTKVGETRRKSSSNRDLVLHIRRHFAG